MAPGHWHRQRAGGLLALLLCVGLTACESSRTLPTRTMPKGEDIACVGIEGRPKAPGIDYALSMRNTILGAVFVEAVIPPIMVLHHETFCPVADTSTARARP